MRQTRGARSSRGPDPVDDTMAQIFSRHANSYVRAAVVLALVLVAAIFGSADRLSRSSYVTRADTFREQPIVKCLERCAHRRIDRQGGGRDLRKP